MNGSKPVFPLTFRSIVIRALLLWTREMLGNRRADSQWLPPSKTEYEELMSDCEAYLAKECKE
jgi:hypothetical protein